MLKIKFIPLLVILLCLSCQYFPTPKPSVINTEKCHKKPLFSKLWWNFYKRGLYYSKEKCFKEAIADFEKAVKQREKDQRKARTFGVNFIDYYPHREMGIIYYETGNPEAAKKELDLSLTQYPSAKTIFYLKRVCNTLSKQKAIKISQPKIELDFKEKLWTRDDLVVLSGKVEDEQYIASVSIGDKTIFILNDLNDLKKSILISETLKLSQGENIIEVKAENVMGGSGTCTAIINVDRKGPEIIVEKLNIRNTVTSKQEIAIRGFLQDTAGVSEFFVNNRKIPIQQDVKVHFNETFVTEADKLELKAFDTLRNCRIKEISLSSFLSYMPLLLASSNSFVRTDILNSKDTHPPNIRIKNLNNNEIVFQEKISVDIEVDDENIINELWINQTPIYRRQGVSISFTHMAELQKGSNTIVIKAKDRLGNQAVKQLTIIRKVPKAFQTANRMSLTISPFEQNGKTTSLSKKFQDFLNRALFEQKRFQIYPKQGGQYNLKGTIYESYPAIGATGEITEAGISGRIVAFVDAYDEVRNLSDLELLAKGMASKIHQEFPLLNGEVLYKQGKEIFTSITHDKLKIGIRLIVYRKEEKVISDKSIMDNKIIGYARITELSSDMTKAELQDCKPDDVRVYDKVITE